MSGLHRRIHQKSLRNIGVETLDLQQFHVWSDTWAEDDSWQRAAAVVMAVVCVVACLLPARRAMRISPVEAIAAE